MVQFTKYRRQFSDSSDICIAAVSSEITINNLIRMRLLFIWIVMVLGMITVRGQDQDMTLYWQVEKGIDLVGAQDILYDILNNDFEDYQVLDTVYGTCQADGDIYVTLDGGVEGLIYVDLVGIENDYKIYSNFKPTLKYN